MNITIVSKTHTKKGICIGGMLDSGDFVRLIDIDGSYFSKEKEIEVGNIYSARYKKSKRIEAPHVEDIIMHNMKLLDKKSDSELLDFVLDKNPKIWKGNHSIIFDGMLKWRNGKGYITEDGITDNSVGFWVPNYDLEKIDYKGKVRYTCSKDLTKTMPYVGFQSPVDIIAKGTLVRISLARWWGKDEPNIGEDRCYLQLSGWY